MRTIHKFTHPVEAEFLLHIPMGAQLLTIDRDTRQPDDLAFWYELESDQDNMTCRPYFVVGTGHPIPDQAETYVGSVKMGYFIWHIYAGSF